MVKGLGLYLTFHLLLVMDSVCTRENGTIPFAPVPNGPRTARIYTGALRLFEMASELFKKRRDYVQYFALLKLPPKSLNCIIGYHLLRFDIDMATTSARQIFYLKKVRSCFMA